MDTRCKFVCTSHACGFVELIRIYLKTVYPLLTIIIIHRITPQPPLVTAFHISATMYASAVNMNRFQEQH